MTNEFLDFVDSYTSQDSIGAENVYQKFVPYWKMNDQVKYAQCWIEQLGQIHEKHKYSLVQTYRYRRSHRSYPKSSGEICNSQDLYIENKTGT